MKQHVELKDKLFVSEVLKQCLDSEYLLSIGGYPLVKQQDVGEGCGHKDPCPPVSQFALGKRLTLSS